MRDRSLFKAYSSAIILSLISPSCCSSIASICAFLISSSYSQISWIRIYRCACSLAASSSHSTGLQSVETKRLKSSEGESSPVQFEFMNIMTIPILSYHSAFEAGLSWLSMKNLQKVELISSLVKSYLTRSCCRLGRPLGTYPSSLYEEFLRARATPKAVMTRWARLKSFLRSTIDSDSLSLMAALRARKMPATKNAMTMPVSAEFQLLTTWGNDGLLTMMGQGLSLVPNLPPKIQLLRLILTLCTHPRTWSYDVQDMLVIFIK